MAIEYDFLLLETGDYLLLEDGGKIIIDERVVPDVDTGGGASSGPSTGSGRSAGWPWPQKLVNVILPHRVLIDDEDVLFIIMDD